MKIKLAVVVAVALLLSVAGSLYAQTLDIRCPDGVLVATPIQDGLQMTCMPHGTVPTVPVPTVAAPAPTSTLTPTVALPTVTATPKPTATPVPTVAPTSTPAPTLAPMPTVAAGGTPLAFPGAEGYGAQTVGGRGGTVYQVTTLADSGPGSLRACAEASGPRICVFRTGGTIELLSTIEVANPYLTIAGQTAPGDGITIKAADSVRDRDVHLKLRTHDIIIRYLRIRPGTKGSNARALSINGPAGSPAYNIVIDHVSLSWAGDEILISWDDTKDVLFSWNNFSESLPNEPEGSVGLKGPNLGKETGGFYSFHHNLMAHHSQRLPNISAGAGPVDVVNNVMYNAGGTGTRALLGAQVNFIANYLKAGPNTTLSTWVKDDGAKGFYLSGNELVGINNILPNASAQVAQPYTAPPVTTTSADVAYGQVLDSAGASRGLTCAGAWYARRDTVDSRIVQSVRAGTTGHDLAKAQTFQLRGYLSTPEQVGGWPVLGRGVPCADADLDGMPDAWEQAHGLNVGVDDSAGDADNDGYTNIEEYING